MDELGALEREGALSTLDVELARALCRLAAEASQEVALAVALASRELQAGHVCADLARLAGRPANEGEGQTSSRRLPAFEPWLAELGRSSLVSREGLADPARPLVLDADGRLYLARYYDHELRVAKRLCDLAGAPPPDPVSEPPHELLDRLFPPRPGALDLQREAALAARARRLSVIVGGPGTGKTSTVVKLLALLVEDALSRARPAPRTLLVAPTGKAAQRLSEAVARARDGLPVSDAIKRSIEVNASTLHRALGPIEGSVTRFRHGPERPLECELALLDEASMVDLALMRRFLEALPANARLVLLGDPDQLASVEAGGVLHDLCRAAQEPQSPLAACVSRLRESHRYPPDSGIAALARAVYEQAPEQALQVLSAGLPDLAWRAPAGGHELGRALEREAREHYAGLRQGELETRLSALERFRVLCAHRAEVEQLNHALSRVLGQHPTRRAQSYAGRPILITQNDYASGLFNGDVGVIHTDSESSRRELRAFFRTGQAARSISLARLPRHESAYAMTVHKSQGSEFERVAIVLPERASPILSRELLYTAVTRAKHAVSIYASEGVLRAAIAQRVSRSSGLVQRLSRPATSAW